MTSGPTRGAGRPTRVGPPHVARAAVLIAVVVFVLIAAFVVIAGSVRIVGDPPLGLGLWIGGGVMLALAELMRRMARPDPADPLTILVGSDEIAFERGGHVVDRVSREEVGAVVLEEVGQSGVQTVIVRGPSGDVVGRWKTGWFGKGSIRPYLALRRHSWPRAIQGVGTMRWVSPDAPA